MTDALRQSRVRPAFLGASIVVFAILVPVVIHASWDYVETRRLQRQVEAIKAKGEPVEPRPYKPMSPEEKLTQSYYRAAAALASGLDYGDSMWGNNSLQLYRADRSGDWTDDLIQILRVEVGRSGDILKYADLAAPGPFAGFESSYSYLTSDLWRVARLSGYRALIEARDDHGEAAVDSLFTQFTLNRRLEFSLQPLSLPNLAFVLEHGHPSRDALVKLISTLDDPNGGEDALRRLLMMQRARYLSDPVSNPLVRSGRRHWAAFVTRPLEAHALNSRLETLGRIIDSARGGWPEQIDAAGAAAPDTVMPGVGITTTWRNLVSEDAKRIGSSLTRYRIARMAAAIEAYRRDHGEQLPADLNALVPTYLPLAPPDPFSGKPLIFKTSSDEYVIYGFGPDRQDSLGDIAARPSGEKRTDLVDGPDIGMRVRLTQTHIQKGA
jgi:hypothetical protein